MAFQHPSLYLSKFEEGLGVFVQPDAEDIPAETVVLRAPVLVSDSDAELNHAQRCMKLALALRDVDADERDALCPRDNEPSEEEPYRNDMRKRAAELMEAPEEERALYAAGVDFAAMDAEQKNQILWNFEKALFNMFHTPHGSFLFRGMGHYINHSCMPNSVWTVDPQNGELTVKTVKTVTEGEEITVGYFAIRDSKVGSTGDAGATSFSP